MTLLSHILAKESNKGGDKAPPVGSQKLNLLETLALQ